jgi:hypothetical protein
VIAAYLGGGAKPAAIVSEGEPATGGTYESP